MSPIKDPSVYPEDWEAIRQRILRRSSEWSVAGVPSLMPCDDSDLLGKDEGKPRCECLGECGVQHATCSGRCWKIHRATYWSLPEGVEKRTILTVAHLDHDAGAGNHSDENLKAFCQGCHLRFDGEDRREKRTGQRRLL